jgi:hypothetical protein
MPIAPTPSMNTRKCLAGILPFAIAGTWSALALGQDVPPPAPPPGPVPSQTRAETVTEKGGPSGAMLWSGALTLGVTYGAGVVVAATSTLPTDHNMFVPIAGPWMALANRGGCGGPSGPSCDASTTYKVLIVADGIGQALGAFMIIDAFLNPETRTVYRSTTASADKPKVRVAPATMGVGGYGMLAVGSF